MKSETQWVTGGTGLVGAALVVELLTRTDDHIVCPTRHKEGLAPQARLTQVLQSAARAYGHDATLDAEIAGRCLAVPAELTQPLCGVAPASHAGGRAREFWHCAADLRYEDRYWPELQRTNITGTRHALALADALGCEVYNQVSTAYVAGSREGILYEEPADAACINNRYEESKVAGEDVVRRATGMTTRILRPSIVIGHSVTKQAVGGLTGAYSVVQRLAQAQQTLARRGVSEAVSILLPADPAIPINFVPVNLVAADAVSLSTARAAGGIFHLTHPHPLALGQTLDLASAMTGLAPPRYALADVQATAIDRVISRQMDFYKSYMRGEKVFDQTSLLTAVPAAALPAFRLDVPDLAEYYHWYLQHIGHQPALPQPA
ncbi:SDR family oxidoreductase [Streptomyces beijiangensis]|uniref:SDR family oxidoreductase n=1 Tax=Streptomyces beijiangensis TaxID=163361 RepID=A0A939FCK2_9ACTN|nr:SDR family oxidoreductase [Streptomyces beijiangensis]MBO0515834.1 SDR family oxidoreductase [Streptomyces beijiangensis]